MNVPPIRTSKGKSLGRGTGGKQKLIDAALELAASTRSLASLGLREVTRYAGLAPNAFYRHFRNFDELGLEVIDLLGDKLRRGLRERRLNWRNRHAAPVHLFDQEKFAGLKEIIGQSVGLVLEFVLEYQVAYTVGIRELHGTSPLLRGAMEHLLEQFAADMAEDVQAMLATPGVDPATLQEISHEVIRQMSFFSMDYLRHPARRNEIRQRAERFITRLFAGEMALRAAEAAVEGHAAAAASPPTPQVNARKVGRTPPSAAKKMLSRRPRRSSANNPPLQ